MKIALLGTGFGQAHAAVYAQRPDVDDVVVFGRTPQKPANISCQFGFATTTGLDALVADPSVDLVDICLPPGRPPRWRCGPCRAAGMCSSAAAGHHAGGCPPHRRRPAGDRPPGVRGHVLPVQPGQPAAASSGSRPAAGALQVLQTEGRTTLWQGYDLGLDTLALDMMHADFDLVTSLLGRPLTIQVTGTGGPGGQAAGVILGYPTAMAHAPAPR